jgi:hypothetical protein
MERRGEERKGVVLIIGKHITASIHKQRVPVHFHVVVNTPLIVVPNISEVTTCLSE